MDRRTRPRRPESAGVLPWISVLLIHCLTLTSRQTMGLVQFQICRIKRERSFSALVSDPSEIHFHTKTERELDHDEISCANCKVDDRGNRASRREVGQSLFTVSTALAGLTLPASAAPPTITFDGTTQPQRRPLTTTSSQVREVNDPNSYAGLVYEPSKVAAVKDKGQSLLKPPPLLVVLHGAATNQEPSVRKALVEGEHAGLPISLLASDMAPVEFSENFCVAAPYSYGKRSFYEDSRGKVLSFIQHLATNQIVQFDPTRIFLFGFSDGATVAVELATSRKFKAAVVASYGFTGQSLPPMALQRLEGIGFWVFHSADDVIFDVGNSDRLVAALRKINDGPASDLLIRYARFETDPLPGIGIPVDRSLRGHTMGIVAARDPELYTWLLSL